MQLPRVPLWPRQVGKRGGEEDEDGRERHFLHQGGRKGPLSGVTGAFQFALG